MFPNSLDRSDIEPWILALEKEDIRAIFHARYRAFYKALEQLLPDPRALRFLPDFAWLRRVVARPIRTTRPRTWRFRIAARKSGS